VERLRAAGIDWHVIPAMWGGGPEPGVYLCDRPRRREELQRLLIWQDQAPRWRGVVLVQRCPPPLNGDWQEHGVVVGGLSLYGDRDMLRQTLAALGR
jgi:hypothetical protein